jgi:hypothetical protein
MDKIIAYCGIVCSECPAYLATQKDDNAARKKVAETWAKQYNMPMKPEDINCDGCTTEGKRHVGYCSVCEIRRCGKDKLVVNCAYCDDYACDKLTKFFANAPHAKASLEKLRKSR